MKSKSLKVIACLLIIALMVCNVSTKSLWIKVEDSEVKILNGHSDVCAATNSNITGRTFFFLGSSVTYGSASGGVSFVDYIRDRNDCTCVKEAVSGTTLVDNDGGSYVSRMKNNFDKNANCDHFICQLSTNDASQGRTLGSVSSSYNLSDFDTSTIIGAMEYIICYAKTTWHCPVSFYTGTYYDSANYQAMIDALYQLKDKWGIGIIDLWNNEEMRNVSAADYARYMSDSIHPTATGYLEWWTPVFEEYLQNFDYSKYESNGLSQIEAENYYEASSNIVVDTNASASNGKNIGGVQRDSYVRYHNVTFDNSATYLNLRYSSSSNDATGQAEIYVDSMEGTPIATIDLPATGTYWSDYATIETKLPNVVTKGNHDIYVKFVNDGSKYYVANVDWLQFSTYPSSFSALSKIEAEAFTDNSGVMIDNDSNGAPKNIGGVNNGDYTKYDNVVFEKKAGEIEINYSCFTGTGGQVYVYADSMDSAPAAVIDVAETGNNWSTYVSKTVELDNPIEAGAHTIYLKFVNNGGYVANVDWFEFKEYVEPSLVTDQIKIEGYQISTTRGGSRVIGSVEPVINGKNVTKWGFIYAIIQNGNTAYPVTDDDMMVNVNNPYVVALDSTPIGTSETILGESTTATYFVRTTLFGVSTVEEFSAKYKVRAYAMLEDGTYVYSDISEYSVYDICDKLYQSTKMNTLENHNYIYNNILKLVNPNYKEVDYNWTNVIVKPGF